MPSSPQQGRKNLKGKRKLNILFIAIEGAADLWRRDLVQACSSHRVFSYNHKKTVREQFKDIDIVVEFGATATHAMADSADSVRLWQVLGTGFNHIDLPYWNKCNIPIANCPGELSAPALAECAFMYILMLSRRWNECPTYLQKRVISKPLGQELEHLRLEIIGFGASARELALRAKAFGLRTSAISKYAVTKVDRDKFSLEFVGADTDNDINKLLAQSDFVSLHIPLNAMNHHFISRQRLRLMKSTAYLVNVARGGLVDENALLRALTKGDIAGAGLDVFGNEPINPKSRLLQCPKVLATPHIAGATDGTSRRRAAFAAVNVRRIAEGKRALNLVG